MQLAGILPALRLVLFLLDDTLQAILISAKSGVNDGYQINWVLYVIADGGQRWI